MYLMGHAAGKREGIEAAAQAWRERGEEDMTTDDAIFIEFLRKLWDQRAWGRAASYADIQNAIQGINAADQEWKDRMLKQFAAITAPPIKGP
jgi:hypothetical protein